MKDKPYVLVTNDDGIDSPGLYALVKALLPTCRLLIVVPREQQTSMGRGALKGKDVGVIEKRSIIIDEQAVEAFAVNGSPSQAVAYGVLELADKQLDYCVSGINYGENLGLAFTCSGTLGATFEADSLGVPGIAFSRAVPLCEQRSEDFRSINWEIEIVQIRRIFRNVAEHGLPPKVRILNVNFPEGINENTEVRITKQANMNFGQYIKPNCRDMSKGYRLEWELNNRLDEAQKDTDIYAMHVDKVISVTPLTTVMSVDIDSYFGNIK